MDRSFIEIEFESTLGGLYWFPLTIMAENTFLSRLAASYAPA